MNNSLKVGDIVKVKTKSPLYSNLRKILSIDVERGTFVGKPMYITMGDVVENGSAPVVNQLGKVTHVLTTFDGLQPIR